MDPRLFDVLWEAYRTTDRMGPDDPIVVMSAYRCPSTNAMLRRRSRMVAEHSQHMLGKAMDTTIPGLSMEKLREIGMRMQRGGVGYYPNAGTPFVHLDVGGVRHWPRMSYDQLARLFPDGKTVHIPSNGKPMERYEEARAEILARGGEAATIAEATQGGGIFGFFAKIFGGGGGRGGDPAGRACLAADPRRLGATRRRQRRDGRTRRSAAWSRAPNPICRMAKPIWAPRTIPAPAGRRSRRSSPQTPQRPEPQAAPVAQPAASAAPEEPQQAAEADQSQPSRAPAAAAPPRQSGRLDRRTPAPDPSGGARPFARRDHAWLLAGAAALRLPKRRPSPMPPRRASPCRCRRHARRCRRCAPPRRTRPRTSAPPRPSAPRSRRPGSTAPRCRQWRRPRRKTRRRPKNGAGFAPALRSASKLDALAASTPPRALKTGFGAKATVLSANTFSKDDE